MDVTYKQNEMSVYRIAVQLEQVLKGETLVPAADWLQRLAEVEHQIQTKKFRMAVVGEFNRGKSSFINVLLGKRILPEDVLATTATINRVTYGEKPKAYLIWKDGGRDGSEIPVEELASYVTKLTESSEKAAAGIREAVVEYPTRLCYNDVDLIDTPGMNDMDDMNAVTVNQLENIDLAAVAINAQYPYSETENRFVVKLLESRQVCQIIFVVTYFDRIRDREKQKLMDFLQSRIQDNVLKELKKHYKPDDRIFLKYHAIFDHLQIYGVSSVDGMEALASNDMELYEKSGFLRLNEELPQVILSSKSVNMLDNTVTLLEEIMGEYAGELKKNAYERQLWQSVEKDICSLFGMAMAELKNSAETGCRREDLSAAAENQKKEMVRNLLNSLGGIRAVTPDDVNAAVLPAMQQEFQKTNRYYQDKRREILWSVYEGKWKPFLCALLCEVDNRIKKYPLLASVMPKAHDRLSAMPDSRIRMKKAECLDPEFVFYWQASPIQAVLQTKRNQSVLPELQRIVNASMDVCICAVEESLKKQFDEQISEVKRFLDSYIGVLRECIAGGEAGTAKETALLSDLTELQKECADLHRRIGFGKRI